MGEQFKKAQMAIASPTTTTQAGVAYSVAAGLVIVANKFGANFDSVETPIIATALGAILSFFNYNNISRWILLLRRDSNAE